MFFKPSKLGIASHTKKTSYLTGLVIVIHAKHSIPASGWLVTNLAHSVLALFHFVKLFHGQSKLFH